MREMGAPVSTWSKDVTPLVVREPQRRGVLGTEYACTTRRENLGPSGQPVCPRENQRKRLMASLAGGVSPRNGFR
ncbi:hypothetical protein LA6_002202 [Marinibacterium anthonyi]|nr:hypothetical protein LA6_002202 [Marinibacterium anthonyi]